MNCVYLIHKDECFVHYIWISITIYILNWSELVGFYNVYMITSLDEYKS